MEKQVEFEEGVNPSDLFKKHLNKDKMGEEMLEKLGNMVYHSPQEDPFHIQLQGYAASFEAKNKRMSIETKESEEIDKLRHKNTKYNKKEMKVGYEDCEINAKLAQKLTSSLDKIMENNESLKLKQNQQQREAIKYECSSMKNMIISSIKEESHFLTLYEKKIKEAYQLQIQILQKQKEIRRILDQNKKLNKKDNENTQKMEKMQAKILAKVKKNFKVAVKKIEERVEKELKQKYERQESIELVRHSFYRQDDLPDRLEEILSALQDNIDNIRLSTSSYSVSNSSQDVASLALKMQDLKSSIQILKKKAKSHFSNESYDKSQNERESPSFCSNQSSMNMEKIFKKQPSFASISSEPEERQPQLIFQRRIIEEEMQIVEMDSDETCE